MSLEIHHDEGRGRFHAPVEGGQARLDYEREDGVVDFRSTYVPQASRGGGVAARLVTCGFEWARESGLCVIPSCSYVRAFVERHPEYEALIAE